MKSQRPTLSDALRDLMKNREYTSTQLAKTLDVDASTLRSYLASNSFAEATLGSIATQLGASAENLSRHYEFRIRRAYLSSKPGAADRSFREQVYRDQWDLEQFARRQDQLVSKAIEELRDGATLCLVSEDQTPAEMETDRFSPLGEQIADAIVQGARLYYFRPSRRYFDQDVADFADVQYQDIEKEHSRFTQRLKALLKSRGVSAERVEVDQVVKRVECDSSPFFTPGHKYLLFHYPGRDDSPFLATAVIPVGREYLHVPLGDRVRRKLTDFCEIGVPDLVVAGTVRPTGGSRAGRPLRGTRGRRGS